MAFRKSHLVVSFIRWFDTYARETTAKDHPDAERVDLIRCIPFFLLHVACIGVYWVGWSWTAVGVAAFLYFARMFAITGFYHRYFSHKTFETNRFWQFMFAVAGSAAVQRGPLWWAANHRHHHQHSDEPEDAHSPVQHSFMHSHMFWILTRARFNTNLKAVPDLAKYPELTFLDRFDIVVPMFLAASMLGLGYALEYFAPQLGTNAMQMLIWGFFISTVVLFHGTCTINSLSHLFGSKRFKTKDQSRNNPLLAIITLGEGWHNNHHRYANSTRQGFYWYEYDITYYILVMMSWFGIIRNIKQVPEHIYREAEGGTAVAVAHEAGE